MGRFRIGTAGKASGGDTANGPVTDIREISNPAASQKRNGYSTEKLDDKLNGTQGSPDRQVSPTLDDVESLDDAAQAAAEKRLVRKLDFVFLPSACISILMKVSSILYTSLYHY